MLVRRLHPTDHVGRNTPLAYPAVEREPTTIDLVRVAIEEARDLFAAEASLAKDDLGETARAVLVTAVAGFAAALLLVIGLTLVLVGALLAAGATLAVALCAGGGLFAVAAGASLVVGKRFAPAHPLGRTRARLEDRVEEIKEHLK
jgi:hypothetical protein